jgi:[ribosomal protein S5]-alanine N-acetyltransferase
MERNDILLRPIDPSDAPVLATLANNIAIWRNVRDRFPHPYTLEHALQFIEYLRQPGGEKALGIEYHGELAGVCGIIPGADIYAKSAEIGYWIGEPYWGRGIATEAVRQLCLIGFQEMGFIRLFAGVMDYNPASMAVLEKNGFELEGIFKNAIFKEGRVANEHRYAKCTV